MFRMQKPRRRRRCPKSFHKRVRTLYLVLDPGGALDYEHDYEQEHESRHLSEGNGQKLA